MTNTNINYTRDYLYMIEIIAKFRRHIIISENGGDVGLNE